MLIPKASHLVERVAERLLKSGALDQSAAQLLQPGETQVDSAAIEPETLAPQPVERQSSLFVAPPPIVAASRATLKPLTKPEPEAASLPGQESVPQAATLPADAPTPAAGGADAALQSPTAPRPDMPARGTRLPVQPAGSILLAPEAAQPVVPLPTGTASRQARGAASGAAASGAAAPPLSAPGLAGRAAADPAAGTLQGPVTIDAVSLERAGMVDWSRTRTRISEEFRLVQRQILRAAFGPGAEPGFSNLLLVTSARPGEGKSFMSTNLAGSIARQGDHHVLLVDADSKRDSICYSLGLAQSRGLLDLVANPKLDPAPMIVKTPIERLSILPVGRERERSAELFSTKEMTRLIQSLGRRYADRLLILDAPPCLSTSDPAVLSQVVGQILFVVEADRTQRDEIEASLDLVQACPTITLVLNKQQISSRYTFGAYSSYYSS